MTPDCRNTLEKYRNRPRELDGHLLARIRVLQDLPPTRRIQRRDGLTLKLSVAAALLAAAGIAEWILAPSRLLLPFAGLALLAASGARLQFLRLRRDEFLDLAREGHALLAHIVMANNDLFEPGDKVLPAAIVFSFEEPHRFDEGYLAVLAARLWDLRSLEAPPAPDHRTVWSFMRSDYSTGFYKVPAAMSGNDETFISDIFIDPRILPERRLADKSLPILFAGRVDVLNMAVLHI